MKKTINIVIMTLLAVQSVSVYPLVGTLGKRAIHAAVGLCNMDMARKDQPEDTTTALKKAAGNGLLAVVAAYAPYRCFLQGARSGTFPTIDAVLICGGCDVALSLFGDAVYHLNSLRRTGHLTTQSAPVR